MAKEVSKQFLREKIKDLEELVTRIKLEGLPIKDQTVLSFFENSTNNIAIWASRGSRNNFEIVFWNSGAEKIYGYPANEAIGKNVMDLIMSDEFVEDAKVDCDDIIDEGISFKNMIATDLNRHNKEITIITNTFRMPDFEQNGEFLQAELGIDISDIAEQLKYYRSVEEVNTRLGVLESLVEVIKSIDQYASNRESLDSLLRHIITISKRLFGNKVFSFISFYKTENEILIPKSNKVKEREPAIRKWMVRMGCTEPVRKDKVGYPQMLIPLFELNSPICIGYMFMEFPAQYNLSNEEILALETFAQQIHFVVRFKIMAVKLEK